MLPRICLNYFQAVRTNRGSDMKSFMLGAALFLLAFPALAVAQTTLDASRIAGSIYPTVIRPAPLAMPKPLTAAHPFSVAPGPQGVTAVCLGSQDHAEQCRSSLGGVLQPTQMAFCNVQEVGLSRCLSNYANALVKLPEAATRTLSFIVRDAQGVSSTVIVLATATQNEQEILEAALDGKPGGNIVAMRMPADGPLVERASVSYERRSAAITR
jgi:hypothetical protein